MIRTLFTTSAIALVLTTGAMAQDAVPPAAAPAVEAPAPATDMTTPATGATSTTTGGDVDTGAEVTTDAHTPWDMSRGYVAVDTDNLGTRLIDQPVYSSTGDEAEEIGKITDIVFANDGQITAVVIGVGGFLGMGEKSVAVDFSSLEFTRAADNTERWVVPTTAEALTSAPEFVWVEDEPPAADMAPANGAVVPPAGGAMAPAAPATN